MNNWDDLRILLAVVRGGSITAGALLLGVDQSTVSRRLLAFEKKLGRGLFLETKTRNLLTPFGDACARTAVKLEEECLRLDQALRLNDQGFEGSIKIQTRDILSNHLLLSVCADFLSQYPKINLRISSESSSDKTIDADIAILATNTPNEDYFGKKLATATFASYATPAFLQEFGEYPEQMMWLNWDDGSPTPTWPALSPNIPDDMCRMRCTNLASLLEATRMGLGATILPCFIGENDPALTRVPPGAIVSKRDVWVFVHADLRQVPKIRAFLDYLYEQIGKMKNSIESE